jgi:hypothetical protein
MNMINKYQQFSAFVESLKRPENASLIEAIQTGIQVVMEAGFEDDIGSAAVKKGRQEMQGLSAELRDAVNTIASKIYSAYGKEGMQDIANVLSKSQLGAGAYQPKVLNPGEVKAIKTSILGRTLPYLDASGMTPENFLDKFAKGALSWDPEKGSSFADYMSGAGMHLQKEGGRESRRLVGIGDDAGEDGRSGEEKLEELVEMDPRMHGKPMQYKDVERAEEATSQELAREKYLPRILQGIKKSLALSDEGLNALTAQLQKEAGNVTDEMSQDDYNRRRKQLDNLRTARKRAIAGLQGSLAEKDVMKLAGLKQELDAITQELEGLKGSRLPTIGAASKEAGMAQSSIAAKAKKVPELAMEEYPDEYEEMGFAGSKVRDPFQTMQQRR